jgi:hypothetical protein
VLDDNNEEVDLKQHFEEDDEIPMAPTDFGSDFQSSEDEFQSHGFTTGDVEDIDAPLDDEENDGYGDPGANAFDDDLDDGFGNIDLGVGGEDLFA